MKYVPCIYHVYQIAFYSGNHVSEKKKQKKKPSDFSNSFFYWCLKNLRLFSKLFCNNYWYVNTVYNKKHRDMCSAFNVFASRHVHWSKYNSESLG